MTHLVVDGRQGEGGGQVLRTSLSLSALTGRSLQLNHIRAGRSRPGLRPQHLTAVRAMAAICNARVLGDKLGSHSLTFEPRNFPQGGEMLFDVNDAAEQFSAGSVTLIWQAMLWPLCFASEPSRVVLRGGTFVPFSPPYHYMMHVAAEAFRQMGVVMTCHLTSWGWMERGRGEISFEVEPTGRLMPLLLDTPSEEPDIVIQDIAAVSNLPAHIPQRMTNRASNALKAAGFRTSIQTVRDTGAGPGAGICLWLTASNRLGGVSSLGRRGLPAEKVADDAVAQMRRFVDNRVTVDQHLADQLLLPMALSAGPSQFTTSKLTLHTLTQADLLRRWLGVQIEIEGKQDQPGQLTVHGIGFSQSDTILS